MIMDPQRLLWDEIHDVAVGAAYPNAGTGTTIQTLAGAKQAYFNVNNAATITNYYDFSTRTNPVTNGFLGKNIVGSGHEVKFTLPSTNAGTLLLYFGNYRLGVQRAYFRIEIYNTGAMGTYTGGGLVAVVGAGTITKDVEHVLRVLAVDTTHHLIFLDEKLYAGGSTGYRNYQDQSFWEPSVTGSNLTTSLGMAIQNGTLNVDCRIYWREHQVIQANQGLQISGWKLVATTSLAQAPPPGLQPLHFMTRDYLTLITTRKNRVLVPGSDGKLWYFDADTPSVWTSPSPFNVAGTLSLYTTCFTSALYSTVFGIVMHYNRDNNLTYPEKFALSYDGGVTWTTPAGLNNRTEYFVCFLPMYDFDWRNPTSYTGGGLANGYVYALFGSGNPITVLRVYSTRIDTATWAQEGVDISLGPTITGDANYVFPIKAILNRRTVSANENLLIVVNGDTVGNGRLYDVLFNSGGAGATLRYSFPANEMIIGGQYQTFYLDSFTEPYLLICTYNTSTATYYFKKSADYGLTWTTITTGRVWFTDVVNRINPYFWGTGAVDYLKQKFFYATLSTPFEVSYWNDYFNHAMRTVDADYISNDFRSVTSLGFMFDRIGNVYRYTSEAVDSFKSAFIDHVANERPATLSFTMDPDLAVIYNEAGRFIELLDGFDNVIFLGRILAPNVTGEKERYEFQAVSVNHDTYKKISYDATNMNTRDIIKAIINQLSFVYQLSSIDPNADFTMAYYRKIQTPVTKTIEFARYLERAVFYTEPSGRAWLKRYDRLTYSGYRWHEGHPGISLLYYNAIDMRVTRSEVAGGTNRPATVNNTGQVRRVYIGDATMESTEGISSIQLQDSNIMNDAECLQMATNRYKIYTADGSGYKITHFVKLRVKHLGFLQPGWTIDFSYDDGGTVIPRGYYTVIGWEPYDALSDHVDVILANNIVLEKEVNNVAKSIARDDDLTGTYYDGTKESTTSGTPVVQNPVARLRAGVFVWRQPEPTAWDFTIATLVNTTAWNTLNLASIVPEGAKGVLIEVQYEDNIAGGYWRFRRFGQTGNFQYIGRYVTSGNFTDEHVVPVGISEDRKVDFQANPAPANWLILNIIILGWFL